jgi:hypothetical protein
MWRLSVLAGVCVLCVARVGCAQHSSAHQHDAIKAPADALNADEISTLRFIASAVGNPVRLREKGYERPA